ncbi:MAG: hypothetical protein O7E52_10125 [Candidatus Poribacteria bacterium]|nr:hypothetical protein [Candidatus Poribacteria bacterium]
MLRQIDMGIWHDVAQAIPEQASELRLMRQDAADLDAPDSTFAWISPLESARSPTVFVPPPSIPMM